MSATAHAPALPGADRAAPRAATLRSAAARTLTGAAAVLVAGNLAGMVWLWISGGNLDKADLTDVLTSAGRLTGYLSAYSALLQVVLLARIRPVERMIGFDRLAVWHRWNGFACLWLLIAHVVLIVAGYAGMDGLSIGGESWTMLAGGVYPGMITATVGTVLLILVAFSSLVIARRKLRYEAWYAVHFLSYAGIALGWFHQIPTGNELVLDRIASSWWTSLYVLTLALIVGYRLVLPAVQAWRHQLRVSEVVQEGPGIVSVRMEGRGLPKLRARGGQFLLWRFLQKGLWLESHPFSLSESPDGRSLRITAKDLGDFTARLRELRPGTRVVAEGPFGVFTAETCSTGKALLIGGGIGVAPVRALAEELPGGDGAVTLLHRVVDEGEAIFRDELRRLAEERGVEVHLVAGDHRSEHGRRLLGADHLRELVPDVAERDVYVCGPPAMMRAAVAGARAAGVPRRRIHAERFDL